MIYIVEGNEPLFIEEKIAEINAKAHGDVIKFDGNDKDFSIDFMVDTCLSNNLFSQNNLVLVKDAPFLTKKIDDKLLKPLLDYVEDPIYETDLVFYSLDNRLNGKLKAYKAISKNAQRFELNNLDYRNFDTYVNQQCNFNQLDINRDAVYLLNSICKRSATLLKQNIEILKNYPGKITTQVVEKLCTAYDENDSFDLINALTNRDISKAISIERKIMDDNDSIMSVIGLLAFQLRFLYQLSYLVSIGKKRNEIIQEMNCSDARYNMSLETIKKLSSKKIIELLDRLSKLDIECKSDFSINDKSRFELFILDLLKG